MVQNEFFELIYNVLQPAAQQGVQADLVVRAALEPPFRRGAFSVSTAGPPTKPLTRAVRRIRAESVFEFRVFDFLA